MRFSGWLSIVMILAFNSPLLAQPTDITVRVKSKGAKFIGTSMGGAQVFIHDADNRKLLAKGITTGGTGDTQRIMKLAPVSTTLLSDDHTAHWTTTLNIDQPIWVEISAIGPLSQRQATNRAMVSQWLIPGKHLTGGDGMVLEIPGMAVDLLSPANASSSRALPRQVEIRANITMMCGCPLIPDGLWDANHFEVTAQIKRNHQEFTEIALSYANQASQFSGMFTIDQPGIYEFIVYAYDPDNGNTGLDRSTIVIK